MKIRIFDDQQSLAKAAADRAVEVIQQAIAERGQARIVASTGESQVNFLRDLSAHREMDWPKVEVFPIGEYIGLPSEHPASMHRFLRDRLVAKTGAKQSTLLFSETERARRMAEMGSKLHSVPADVAFVGIGENARLGMNTTPADFEAHEPYLIIDLDFAYRRQQVNEGWFVEVGQVPMQAISMSIGLMLKAREILAMASGGDKALAVKVCVEHGVSPTAPASILRTHPNTTMYLDRGSSAQLSLKEGS
jgi:glucosamine-6-phosphate deaminase